MQQSSIRYIKNLSMFLMVALFLFSCKNVEENKQELDIPVVEEVALETKNETESELTGVLHGEYIYTPEAAVFTGKTFIYGVELNDLARELATRVDAVKKEDYDIVPVSIQGKITKKPEGTEGWDEIITITQIISVSDTPIEADVKI